MTFLSDKALYDMKNNHKCFIKIISGLLFVTILAVSFAGPAFSATALPGSMNNSAAEAEIDFKEKEKLTVLCKKVLKTILKDGMTEEEKASAIYHWVEDNISYVHKPDFASWESGAYDTLTTYTGDCYAFYSALRALLEEAGIPCIEGTSIPKDHYWVIAYINGKWWHLDATPGWGGERFMLTTQELLDYEYYGNKKYKEGLKYEFDPADYPEILEADDSIVAGKTDG